ncbi:MAG: MauE/DoxX family redox-associated membrane protein [Candidatus Binataceae bacterium]
MARRPLPNGLRVLLVLGRVALGIIFIYAAWTKLKPPTGVTLAFFAIQVDSYQLLPQWAVIPLAHALPFCELALGLLLIIGWPLRWITSTSSALLLVFFSVMIRSYSKGLEISCACFGAGERIGPKSLLRDGALLALSLAITAGAFFAARRATSGGILPSREAQKAD